MKFIFTLRGWAFDLIKAVVNQATIPVIETGAGICHTYFDEFGDVSKGADIIYNAKHAESVYVMHWTVLSYMKKDWISFLCFAKS